MTIHSPTQQAGLARLPMLAIAGAMLAFGFAAGQITPNVVTAIGAALDSPRAEVVAPVLTRADDAGTRNAATGPVLTRADDAGTRNAAAGPVLTRADDAGTRNAAAGPVLTRADDAGTRNQVSADTGGYVERAGGR